MWIRVLVLLILSVMISVVVDRFWCLCHATAFGAAFES